MTSRRSASRFALIAGGGALVAMGVLTAGCGSTTTEEPTTTTTTTTPASSVPAVSPSEKAVRPGDDYSFSPSINPTPPGAVCREVVNGVCIR